MTDTLSEIDLIVQSQAGNRSSFGGLVDLYKQRVYAVAFQMMKNHADADEMAQRAFVKAFQSINQFEQRSSFFTWIYRLTMNVCIDYLRSRKPTVSIHESTDDDERGLQLRAPGEIDESIERSESEKVVWSALNQLTPELRATVVSVYLQGMAPKEAAGALGCAEATVHWRMHRARKILKKHLLGQLEGPHGKI